MAEEDQIKQGMNPLEALQSATEDQAAPETVASATIEGDPNLLQQIGNAAKDLGLGAVAGVRNGLQETAETFEWASEGVTNTLDTHLPNAGMWVIDQFRDEDTDVPYLQAPDDADLFGDGDGQLHLPQVPDAETTAGGMVQGVSQFMAGFGVAGRGLRAARGLNSVARSGIAGMSADFMAFDAHEARFSDFLRDNVGLRDPITAFLASDEDDSVLEGKLKNTLEGFGLGVATDGLVRLVGSFRRAKRVQAEQGDEAAAEVMNEEVQQLQEEQPDLFDITSDPNLDTDPLPQYTAPQGNGPAGEPAGGVTMRQAEDRAAARPGQPEFDTTSFQEAIDREMGLVRGGSLQDPNRTLEGSFINWGKLDSEYTTQDYLKMATDAVPDSAIQDTKTFARMESEAVDFLADSVEGSADDIRSYLARAAADADGQQKALLGGKMLMQSLAREIETLAYKIDGGSAADGDWARMARLQQQAMEISSNVKTLQKSAAQTTAAGRIRTSDVVNETEINSLDMSRMIDEYVDDAGGRQHMRELARELVANKKAGNGQAKLVNIAARRDRSFGQRFWGKVNEVRINGLLSGPRTHAINALSNSLQMSIMPAEKILGGAISLDPSMVREGSRQYAALASSLRDSLKVAGIALKEGRNKLDPEAALLERNGADIHEIRSDSENPVVRNFVNGLGHAIRLPSRALMGSDEFFKQMNYRADLQARLTTQASDLVSEGRLQRDQAAPWVHQRMQAGIGRQGQARDLASLDYAREATFTQDLRPGSFPRRVQQMTNEFPAMKMILPFVRTPTNIIVAGAQRTPFLHLASKRMREDLRSGDPSRVSRARGKVAFGSMLWGSAVMMAVEGKFTGSGPVDPVARKRLEETGWQPYSYVQETEDGGRRYISYERLDPFAMFFGMAADIADIGGQLGKEEQDQLAVAGLTAVANNVASKTWLQGLTDAVNAFANPEMSMEYYLNSQAVSMMPFSAMSRTAAQATDGVRRDTRGEPDQGMMEMQSMVNSFKAAIPGFSETLPARRSWVTGQPFLYGPGEDENMVTPLGEAAASMNPMQTSEWKQDPVLDEMAELSRAFSPPTRKILGVEMTPQQYETMLELHGKVRSPTTKRTMYEELRRLFESPTYDRERQRYGDASDASLDTRSRMVSRVVNGYRELARAELMRIYPDLEAQVRERRTEARDNARARYSGITELGN